MIEKKPTDISPNEIKIPNPEQITKYSEYFWKLKGKEYYNSYNDVYKSISYQNLLEEDGGDKLLFYILKLYFEIKGVSGIQNKLLIESINNIIKSIQYGSDPINKTLFLSKINAIVDYLKEYELD